ncbi:MAG: hypothetical protein Q9171_001694 [Xanthocarpia ochracea]
MATISIFEDGLQIWDLSLKSLTPTQPRRETHETIKSLQFSPRGTFIAAFTKGPGSNNLMLKLYNTGDYQLVFACGRTINHDDAVSFSPSDERLAAASPNGTISLWHPSTETDSHILTNGPSSVSCLAFSSDGKQLALGSEDGILRIWDPKTKALRRNFEHAQSMSAATFSLDSTRLASLAIRQELGNDTTARLWDISTGNLLYESDGFPKGERLIALSPNNKYIAHYYRNSSVFLYDLESKERRNLGTDPPSYVTDLAFSGDSQYIAFAHFKETGLYRINPIQQVAVFPSEWWDTRRIMSLSVDGKYLENAQGTFRTRQSEADIAGRCPKDVNCWSYRDQWIVEGENKMLWLPPEFQTCCVTHHNGLFAFGHDNGYRLLGFSQDPVVLNAEK